MIRALVRLTLLGFRTIVLVAVVLCVATVRVVSSGEAEIEKSTSALRAGDPHAAILHARRAAGFYAPFAPHVRVAYERLLALGRAAEGLGDRETALFAFRAVRTASIETRWIVAPHAADRAFADVAIARLAAESPRSPVMRTEAPRKLARDQLEILARDEGLDRFWILVAVGGAMAAALGAMLVLRRSGGSPDRFNWSRTLPGIAMTLAGVAAWVVAILRA